jgi:inorganic triphosphatase YgiF
MLAPSITAGRELELKFELPGDDFHRLGESPFLKASADAHSRKTLRSVYFDTPGHGLRKARIALRLRSDGGDKWLQTVKAGEEPKGGLLDVAQSEVLLESFEPDLDRIGDKGLRRKVKKICDKPDLKPVFETIVDRTTHVITKEDCAVELALDEGRVEADGQSRPFREVELELLSGSPQGMLGIARELFSDFRIRPSISSKAGRGYRLLLPERETSHPLHAKDIKLRHGDTARDAFKAILRSSAEQIIANQQSVIEAGAVEAVHQMRVGLTRLRSALRSIKRYSKASWVHELESDAQNVARSVGALRDADVLIAEIYMPIAEEHGNGVPGFPALLQALKAHRDTVYKEAVDTLGKGIWARLLVTMILSPHLIETGGKFEEPVATVAGESLERRWRKVSKFGEHLDSLDLEERHGMRKALKKLRYNCEFFQTLYNHEARSFIKRLKEMQELFGAINDVRMAEQLIPLAVAVRRKDSKALAAAGYVLGHHQANVPVVWSKAKREWERLEKASGFWR